MNEEEEAEWGQASNPENQNVGSMIYDVKCRDLEELIKIITKKTGDGEPNTQTNEKTNHITVRRKNSRDSV
jgi:hypothetical protein